MKRKDSRTHTSLNSMVTVSVLAFPVMISLTTPMFGCVLFLLTLTVNSLLVLQGQRTQEKTTKAQNITLCQVTGSFVYISRLGFKFSRKWPKS